jgi:hypothetical protein
MDIQIGLKFNIDGEDKIFYSKKNTTNIAVIMHQTIHNNDFNILNPFAFCYSEANGGSISDKISYKLFMVDGVNSGITLKSNNDGFIITY